MNADRAFIARYDFEKQIGTGLFEWCEKEITPQIQQSQKIPLSIAPEWVDAHRNGEYFSVDQVDSMPNSQLKTYLMSQQIQSFITLPMIQEDDCIGFVGFDWVRTAHHDAEIEEPLLRLFAQMLVNVEIRKATELQLTQAQMELIDSKEKILHQLQCSEMVRRITRTFINSQLETIDMMIQDMLAECGIFFQVDRAYVFQVSDDDQFMVKTHLWQDPQIEPQKHWLSSASMGTYRWFRDQLQTRDRIQIDSVEDFPIEAGKMELRLEEASIEDICRSAMDSVRHHAQTKKLSLSMEIDPDLISATAETDSDRLRQVLLNLLSNAVKFTHEGEITLTVAKETHTDEEGRCELRFSITDTGQGIEEKEREKIFEDFYQTDASATRKQGGSGLGLAISRRILNALGSRLELFSQPGEGSTFSFRITVKVISFAPSPKVISSSEQTDDNQAPEAGWKENAYQILIAEDNPINQKLLKTLLIQHLPHASLSFADNGVEAVQQWKSLGPDLILMDLLMPEMDGIQAAGMIRSQQTVGHTPIIALTAAAESQDMGRCIEAGMDGYLTKPIKLESLISELEKWLGDSER